MKRLLHLRLLFAALVSFAAVGIAFAEDAAKDVPDADSVKDLPLIEVAATGQASSDTLVFIVSGDGGWAAIDKGMSKAFTEQGIPVVGLNSLKYFWSAKTPDTAGKDTERILRHYLKAWDKQKAIVIGYSFGADVAPFMVSPLPEDVRSKVQLMAMLGASPSATFEFHVMSDWFGAKSKAKSYPTKPEVEKLKGIKVLCVYGEDDTDCLCTQLKPETAKSIRLPGSHHFDKDYAALATLILKERPEPAKK